MTLSELKKENTALKKENAALKRENEKMLKRKNKTGKKREPSAYNIFIGKTMKDLKIENPTFKAPAIMALAAEKWNIEKTKN